MAKIPGVDWCVFCSYVYYSILLSGKSMSASLSRLLLDTLKTKVNVYFVDKFCPNLRCTLCPHYED